jgi:hypothetical protein
MPIFDQNFDHGESSVPGCAEVIDDVETDRLPHPPDTLVCKSLNCADGAQHAAELPPTVSCRWTLSGPIFKVKLLCMMSYHTSFKDLL